MTGIEIQTILYIVVIIAIFMVCRELVCWYWKQNQQVELLKDIRHSLEQLLDVMDPGHQGKKTSAVKATKSCKHCSTKNVVSNTHCLSCGQPF